MNLRMRVLTAYIAICAMGITDLNWAEELILEEVVVRAQKREQSIQDVPLAVSAFDALSLKAYDVNNILDISRASPSVSFTPQQSKMSNNPLRIRGVGASGTNPAFEGSVGIYMDGAYRSRAGMALATLSDVDTIEILRGPQGTLFGKNTSAGAITIRSMKPTENFAAGGQLQGGSDNQRRLDAFVSGPVSESLLLRGSVMLDSRDGFIVSPEKGSDYGDIDTQAYKFQAQYQPSDDFDVRLILDYLKTDEQCCFGNTVRITDDALDPMLYQPLANSVGYSVISPADPYRRKNTVNREGSDVVTDNGVLLDMTWQLGDTRLRSLTSYREWDYKQPGGDADFGPVDLLDLSEQYNIDTFSQEFNWSGSIVNKGPVEIIDFVTGIYFARESIDYQRSFQEGVHGQANWATLYDTVLGLLNFTDPGAPGYLPPSILATPGVDVYRGTFDNTDDMAAVYGHFTFQFSEQWSVIAGLRYNYEKKEVEHEVKFRSDPTTQSFGFYLLGATTGGRDFDESHTDKEFTGNLALQYNFDADVMAYASYSRGYKAGGISLNSDAGGEVPSALSPTGFTPRADPSYKPEFVDAYELGLKSTQFGGRSRTNLSVFYQDYSDIQFQVFTGTEFVVFNASSAETKGVELENRFQFDQYLQLNLAVTWLDASYGNEKDAPENLIGRDLDHAPDWASTIGVFYDRPITAGLTGFANINWSYMGEHYTDTATETKQDAYNLFGLNFGVRAADDSWSISAWCRNCSDEEYIISSFAQPFYFGGAEAAYIGAPSTWGVTLSAYYQ